MMGWFFVCVCVCVFNELLQKYSIPDPEVIGLNSGQVEVVVHCPSVKVELELRLGLPCTTKGMSH